MSSRRNSQSQDLRPESPLSDRSPRQRDASISRKRSTDAPAPARLLSPKTPLPLPGSSVVPKRPRRYSAEKEKVTELRIEEVHRPTDRVVEVDLEELEKDIRGGTPRSVLSIPADSSSILNDSASSHVGPRTSTPKKSSKSRRAPQSLLKKVLLKSVTRNARPPTAESSMDSSMYRTAQESMANSSAGSNMSPIRIEIQDGYRSTNSTQRALFSQQGAAPLPRRVASRSASRTRLPRSSSSSTMCQLVTPLVVHTSQEVNAVSVTGQVLVISQTLVRSAHASTEVRKLMNRLAEKQPLISNEMSQVDIDHDNEHSKHEVFVGSDAILIQRISTIHRGRDRNSFETDNRRTYRFICQGDLLPEDRRNKQSKPRHLTIIAESATTKNCEEIEKSERVVLVFDAADEPKRVLAPMPPETSLTHAAANDLTSRPSALKDSPVSFEEHVRVSDHSHINIVRKAHVTSSPLLWDEPLTELKEQRVYRQQLADDAQCEPVRITRSHSMTRGPVRERSLSASRRAPRSPSLMSRGRTPGRTTRNSSVLRPLTLSPPSNERRPRTTDRPGCTPMAPRSNDLVTCMSPIQDEPARREELPRRRNAPVFDADDDTFDDSASLPVRTSAEHKTLRQQTLRFPQTLSPVTALQMTPPAQITTAIGPFDITRSSSRSPAKRLSITPTSQQKQQQPQWQTPRTPTQEQRRERSKRTPLRDILQQEDTPIHTARQQSPTRPVVVIDEDTSAGSSQSPTQNRTPTTVSPRRARLTTAVYESPAAHPSHRRLSSPRTRMDDLEHMLDATQPSTSPMAAGRGVGLPAEHFAPAAAPASDSRLARSKKPLLLSDKLRAGPSGRPLGLARSCSHLPPAAVQHQPYPRIRTNCFPARRALSEHSVFQASQPPLAPLVAHANSAITIASPYRGQGYVRSAEAPAAAPVPRPRTTRPPPAAREPSSDPPIGLSEAVAVSASASATRVSRAPSPIVREFLMPRTVVGKPATKGSTNTQKNVTLVHNPEDYNEGEILKKRLTLEAKINGHMWHLSVTFALKADRADLVRFAPKRVRIDEQTLWEETENWSQTSLTPITGPRTAARGSNSYDQLQPVAPDSLPKPAGSAAQTTSLPTVQSGVRVAPKAPKTIATASTASSASKRSADKTKKSASKRSTSGENKHNNGAPFI